MKKEFVYKDRKCTITINYNVNKCTLMHEPMEHELIGEIEGLNSHTSKALDTALEGTLMKFEDMLRRRIDFLEHKDKFVEKLKRLGYE